MEILRRAFWFGLWLLGVMFYAAIIVVFALLSPILYLAQCLTAADVSPAWRSKEFGTGADWESPLKILAHWKASSCRSGNR